MSAGMTKLIGRVPSNRGGAAQNFGAAQNGAAQSGGAGRHSSGHEGASQAGDRFKFGRARWNLKSTFADLSVSKRLVTLVAVLAIGWAACMGTAVAGLIAGKGKANQANAVFAAFKSERDAYEGWLTDDDQSNMSSALASLKESSQRTLLNATIQQVLQGYEQAISNLDKLPSLTAQAGLPRSINHLIGTVKSDLTGYNKFTNQVISDIKSGHTTAAIVVMSVTNAQISNNTQAAFDSLGTAISNETEKVKASVSAQIERSLVLIGVLALIGMLLGSFITRWVINSIIRPLRLISGTLDSVRDGVLTVHADVDSKDELGNVARGLNDAISAQAEALGDLESRGKVDAAAASQARQITEIVGTLQGATSPRAALAEGAERFSALFGFGDGKVIDAATAAASGSALASRSISSSEVEAEGIAGSERGAGGRGTSVAIPVLAGKEVAFVVELSSPTMVIVGDRQLEILRSLSHSLSETTAQIASRQRERAAEEELRSKVEEILGVVNAAAGGDLTVEVPVSGADPVGQVGESLARLLADLRARMGSIGESSRSLAGSAEELTVTAVRMSAGAEETSTQAQVVSETSDVVSDSVQTVASAAEELTASIQEIAFNATEAAKVATLAAEAAVSTNVTVAKLGESSAEIGSVVKVITTIAQKTNLLALNASIEAARAGEAGKGFAVVANEVKDLAGETAIATQEISGKIEAIQNDAKGAVVAIECISQIIDQINELQSSIATAVEEQTSTTNEIARSASSAAQGVAEITVNISGVAQGANDTSLGTANTEQAASNLAGLAAELQGLVGRFTY